MVATNSSWVQVGTGSGNLKASKLNISWWYNFNVQVVGYLTNRVVLHNISKVYLSHWYSLYIPWGRHGNHKMLCVAEQYLHLPNGQWVGIWSLQVSSAVGIRTDRFGNVSAWVKASRVMVLLHLQPQDKHENNFQSRLEKDWSLQTNGFDLRQGCDCNRRKILNAKF